MTCRDGRTVVTLAVLVSALTVACDSREPSLDYAELSSMRALGLAHLEEERPAEAAEQFATLATEAPAEPLGPANLAVARLRLGEIESALAASEEAMERAPADPHVLFVRATVLDQAGRPAEAREALRNALAADSLHAGSLWALSRLDSASAPSLLERVVSRWPSNLAARMDLAESYAEAGSLDDLARHAEYVRQLLPAGEGDAKDELVALLAATRAGDAAAALRHTRTLHNLVRVDPMYGEGLRRLSAGQALVGTPMERFSRLSPTPEEVEEVWRDVTFVAQQEIADVYDPILTDLDGDGDADVVARLGSGTIGCFRNDSGRLVPLDACTRSGDPVQGRPLLAADFDGDARSDLVIDGPRGLVLLPSADTAWADPKDVAAMDSRVRSALAVDADHDGDLDLLVGRRGASRLYRQTATGSFSEVSEAAGIAAIADVRSWSAGDLDGDGDLDLVAATEAGVILAWNLRHGKYAADAPLAGLEAPSAVRVLDVDHDGLFDVVASQGSGLYIARNQADGVFSSFEAAVTAGPGSGGGSIEPIDFDNDGTGDIVLAAGTMVSLLRGTQGGSFEAVAGALPSEAVGSRAADLDADGDEDLLLVEGAGVRILRNDGGNLNHHLAVRLLALADGSGKVNRLGLGSRLDVSAGDLRISRVVWGETEHFGLGGRSTADVVRIEWTNGVPQNVLRPEVDAVLVETQVLKGSCGFLFVWTGERFEFVTDMMWKSALGMPLGIMAGETFYAPPEPSLEYVRIPPGMLQPRDGWYETRITEELWEVGYLDELALIAVEHPVGTEVYVNEEFSKPDRPNSRLYVVGNRRLPDGAVTGDGRDVSELLANRDFQFVGGFDAGPFQGTTELHDLVLTMEAAAGAPSRLFLSGWLFPTDASINVSIGQSGAAVVVPPYLEVPSGDGGWQRLDVPLSFPTGKNKTVVVDLPRGVPSFDPRLRIRTTMEIYWDEAFYHRIAEEPQADLRTTRLDPVAAELSVRGFSRVFRRGGRYGPHWFDYEEVSAESPWRPLPGTYTAEGDVLPLLGTADDQYVVFGAGDEIAVRFEALDDPADGMARTFFLYSDAFLKDADLNTLGGQTVEPLPLHGQVDYPTGLPEPDPGHEAFVGRYQTRVVR